MKTKVKFNQILFILWIVVTPIFALDWQEITGEYSSLPESVKLFKATRINPKLEIYYLDVDLNSDDVTVRSYITDNNTTVPGLSNKFGCIAAVNGGFFGGSVSYSAVVYPGEVKSKNVRSVTRNGKSYPVMRSMFSLDNKMKPEINWIYHFGSTVENIYKFDAPMQYSYNDPDPKETPDKNNGQPFENLLTGIGGGPVLIKDGQINITYNEEIMWGSGVGLSNNDPRTAIGYTDDNHVIMIVADGRQGISEGVSLNELADILMELGCKEGMNLDGGGSSQMAINGQYVNSPSDYRAVPTIFAIVHRDSLTENKNNEEVMFLDTDDENTEIIGTGWFATANDGFWGESKSMLHTIGSGENQMKYNITFQQNTTCDVYGWWVAANNRCTNTPYIINHKDGIDTIRVNQTQRHASWVYLGEYTFGIGNQDVIVSDAGTGGSYVVADGIKLVIKESTMIEDNNDYVEKFELYDNYPNPFNPTTIISFQIPKRETVNLSVYDITGKLVSEVVETKLLPAGKYNYFFDGRSLASGLYFYSFTSKSNSRSGKMLLIK